MSDYIIHNINIAVRRVIDFDGFEEPDKPTDRYPNYYLGKLIGKRGTKMDLFRTRQGGKEEDVPNCVLRNDGGIALIRVHNKESLTIYDLPENSPTEINDCVGLPKESYPFSYVVVDYRDGKCTAAIEKSSVWDSKTTTVRNSLEKFFQSEPFTSHGFTINVKEKSIPTEFEKFLDQRTIDYGDVVESFTFEYVDIKNHPNAQIPEELTEEMDLYSKILEIHGALSGTNTVKLSPEVKKEKLKQLSHVVTMCCVNGFNLSVKLRDYGDYTCNENILAKFPMNEIVISHFKDFVEPEESEKSHDFVLSLWLDMVNDKIENNTDDKEIPGKPKG